MKEEFREFYYKEEIDFKNLDESILIVFDTNVLLHIFRFSISSRKKLISSMEKVKSNVWIPYHVGLEYNLHKVRLISKMREAKVTLKEDISNDTKNFKNTIFSKINNIGIKSSDEKKTREGIKDNFSERLNKLVDEWQSEELEKEFELIGNVEDESERIADIFQGKVGKQFTQDEISAIEEEGEIRYSLKFSPGYKDENNKDKNIRKYGKVKYHEKYSDLIIWKQIIDKAKDDKINKIVFVTDDEKEDWQYGLNGKKRGPRAELKKELLDETNADLFLLNTNSFINQVNGEHSEIVDLSRTYNFPDNYKSITTNEDHDLIIEFDVENDTILNDVLDLERSFYLLNHKMTLLYDSDFKFSTLKKDIKNEFFEIQREITNSMSRIEILKKDLIDNLFEFNYYDRHNVTIKVKDNFTYYSQLNARYEFLLLDLNFK